MIYQKRLLFILSFIFILGCYNNAHIQTQRELKKGESSTNISVIVPVYNSDERFETWIAAQRIEFSHLKGYNNFELGYYGGIGNNIDWGFFPWALGGFIWRKNINNNFLPFKMGLHAEYGQYKESDDEQKQYSGFQIRPSVTTLTSSKKRSYFGAHGLLSTSKRTEDRWHYDFIDTESGLNSEKIKTVEQRNCNTYGFGFTGGWEIFSKSFSVQTQLDISMIRNAWEEDRWRKENDTKPETEYTLSPLISLSAGINFFNPIEKTDQAFTPTPNEEQNVIAIDYDDLVIDESESYSFIESSPKSYAFSEKLDQKREPEEAYNPYELARKHMKEPTVHKFLAYMSPFITSLGLFTTAFHTSVGKSSYPTLSYAYPFFGIVPHILSECIAKNSRWLEDKSKNTSYKKMYVGELRKLRYSKTIKYFGIITAVGVLPVGFLLSDPW